MTDKEENTGKKRDLIFVILIILFIGAVSLFNFLVDPYNVFDSKIIKGFNDQKIYMFTNRRTIINSQMKYTGKNKKIAFIGNCLIYSPLSGYNDVGFYTLTIPKENEVSEILKRIKQNSPDVKTVYFGIFMDNLWNMGGKTDDMDDKDTRQSIKDYINLFFSWNTTKYSIETVVASLKYLKNPARYVYPYRETVTRTYDGGFREDAFDIFKKIKDYAAENGINLIFYYSPLHISKKVYWYETGMWGKNCELKRRLAEIGPFYDYSFINEYNTAPLDENSINYTDNVHSTYVYNEILLKDILSDSKKLALFVDKNNVDEMIKKETEELEEYIKQNPEIAEKYKNATPEDANVKIKALKL